MAFLRLHTLLVLPAILSSHNPLIMFILKLIQFFSSVNPSCMDKSGNT